MGFTKIVGNSTKKVPQWIDLRTAEKRGKRGGRMGTRGGGGGVLKEEEAGVRYSEKKRARPNWGENCNKEAGSSPEAGGACG